jgi:hypothetical protein
VLGDRGAATHRREPHHDERDRDHGEDEPGDQASTLPPHTDRRAGSGPCVDCGRGRDPRRL